MTNKAENPKDSAGSDADLDHGHISDIDSELANAETEIIDTRAMNLQRHQAKAKAPAQPSWAGKTLGHFKLLRLIGQGNMGRVIQAKDISLHRIVALKILNKNIPGINLEERVSQFLREARAAAKIEHPNVVHIYEINHHKGWWYIAMEMLDGENLRKVVQAAGPLSAQRASSVIADAATGLAVAHDMGIIHRDIKPTNLMLNRQGRCKITDFGLVRMEDPSDPHDFTDKAVGSPHFIAPEIILRQKQTSAIDVYSLGATLYFALTGTPPFVGTKLKQILRQHVEAPVPDVRQLRPELPLSISNLIERAMAKDPEARPTASDMAGALRAEAINYQSDYSSSNIAISSLALTSGPSAGEPSFVPDATQKNAKMRPLYMTTAAAVLIMVVSIAISIFSLPGASNSNKKIDLADLPKDFPGASASYGVLQPSTDAGYFPGANEPPAFSWIGKADASKYKFVASKSGRYYYSVTDSKAALISMENFVGYRSAAEAEMDGKVAAE